MSPVLLSYQVFGGENIDNKNKRVPLVFLHGMLGDRQNWRSQAGQFANTYQVITVDLRNHGESPHLKDMSYRQMADDVLALLSHLNIPRVHLCGHSMGGKVAMYLALHHSDVIGKLIIVDIAPVTYPLWHQSIFQVLLSLPISELKSRQNADELLSANIEDPFERAFLLKNLQRTDKGFRWKCDLEEIARNYLKIAGFPTAESTYDKPVLFIKGENSQYVAEAFTPLILAFFPNAIFDVIKEAGHLPHVQQPTFFSDQLRSFLEDNREPP